jgi:hypothetical protein
LEHMGFIRPHQRGAFHLKARHATSWLLTEFPFGGQPPTKDFMRWQPSLENKNPVPAPGTVSPRSGDRGAVSVPSEGPYGPRSGDRGAGKRGSHGPRSGDTDKLPRGEGVGRRAEPSGERSAPTELRPIGNIAHGILAHARAMATTSHS